MVKIKPIEKKKTWEKFLLSCPRQPFFQSWDWGEVQKKLGNRILRLGIFDGGKLVGICQVIEVYARRGHFFHLRHGPVFLNFQARFFDPLQSFLVKEAKKQKVVFIRMSPLFPKNEKNLEFFKRRKFHDAPIHQMDAETCWVLDLFPPGEELLRGMRKTTRYLIRKGGKEGLEVVKTSRLVDGDFFLKLYQKTIAKHGFVPHQGIKEEFEVFTKDNQALLFLARFKKRVISGALVIFYGNQAIYHHGATDPAFERLSPSYLLQWEAIEEAKKRGKKFYNFWGIAPPDKPRHPWAGLTLFKKGFGGRIEEFLHAQDLPLGPAYWLTWAIETLRRIAKGY